MKSKIILVNHSVNEETEVATFKSTIEAFQCASLLQALVNSENFIYYVDHWIKGKGHRRTQPDNIRIFVSNSLNLYEKLKPIF